MTNSIGSEPIVLAYNNYQVHYLLIKVFIGLQFRAFMLQLIVWFNFNCMVILLDGAEPLSCTGGTDDMHHSLRSLMLIFIHQLLLDMTRYEAQSIVVGFETNKFYEVW